LTTVTDAHALELDKLLKRFGSLTVIDSVSLQIRRGEVVSLLGPSGCGKTTTLRCIAGFYAPDDGSIRISERVVASKDLFVPPEERRLAMVFQNYVLWPHMRTFDNVAYGLRLRNTPKDEIRRRVTEVMALLGLKGLEDRYPHALSGGQQQRVSVARSLVVEPDILLLDEPFSNLDAKLRIEMRQEMRGLLKRLGTTAIYVTHDQEEAMVLSDRIFLMNRSRIVQSGSPIELFERPQSEFTARFFGITNILRGTVGESSDTLQVDGLNEPLSLGAPSNTARAGDEVLAGLREADLDVAPQPGLVGSIRATVLGRIYLGGSTELELKAGAMVLKARVPGSIALSWPDEVWVRVAPGKAVLFREEALP
jgi:iron(III) transport system ATP-binding protein